MNWRTVLVMIAVVACAIAGLNFHWQPAADRQHSTDAAAAAAAEQVPDLLISAPVLDRFSSDGERDYHATGDTLRHFDSSQQSVLDQPRIQLYHKSGDSGPVTPGWHVSADSSVMRKNRQQVQFNGHVIVDNPASDITISSEQLDVDPRREFASTDKAVKIRARRSVAEATGLQADLNSEQLRLPGRVKETHEVTQH